MEDRSPKGSLDVLAMYVKQRRQAESVLAGVCPFCGRDPYHYVDNGVGMEAVAVVCCDGGIGLFQHHDQQLVELAEQARAVRISASAWEGLAWELSDMLDGHAALSQASEVSGPTPSSHKDII